MIMTFEPRTVLMQPAELVELPDGRVALVAMDLSYPAFGVGQTIEEATTELRSLNRACFQSDRIDVEAPPPWRRCRPV